jgi:hypothetical protein
LQKETVLLLVKGSAVFINYLGACAFRYLSSLYTDSKLCLKKLLRTSIDSQTFCVSIVLFIIISPHDVALSKQHKSISASDVLNALDMLEFIDTVEQLQGE